MVCTPYLFKTRRKLRFAYCEVVVEFEYGRLGKCLDFTQAFLVRKFHQK